MGMAASSINDLPSEIIDKILYFVISKQCLRNVAICCRRFNRLVNPHLYEHIDLVHGGQYHSGAVYPQLRPLAAHLLRRPDLAQCMQRFIVYEELSDGFKSKEAEASNRPPENMVDVENAFKEIVQTLATSPEEEQA